MLQELPFLLMLILQVLSIRSQIFEIFQAFWLFVVRLNQVLRCDLHFSEILITPFNLILLVTSSWICGTFREIKNIKLFKIIFRQGDFFSNKTYPPSLPLLIWFWYEGVLWTKYLKFGGSTMEILKYDCTMMTNYVEIIFIL